MKRFIGIKFSVKQKEQEELSSRLASFNPLRFPAESRGLFPPIDDLSSDQRMTYKYSSYTEEEVKRLVQRVTEKQSLSAAEIQNIVDRLATKPEGKKSGKNKSEQDSEKKFSAGQVKALVERLAAYDPEIAPADSRGKPARERDLSDLLKGSNKAASSADVKAIVDRLSQYDTKKWPPGSRNAEDNAAPRSGTKKCSEEEVDQIVSRLTNYDKKRWPPESVGMKQEFYQGKPQRFNNTK